MVCLDNAPFVIMLTAGSCTIVLLLWKTNSFSEMLYFWWTSANSYDAVSYFRIVSGLCGKVHSKTLCSICCWSLAKFTENIGLWTVNSFPIQPFKFIHSVSSGTMLALLWFFLALWKEKQTDKTSFWQKQLVSILCCSITWFRVHDSEYKYLIPYYLISDSCS